MSNSSFTRRCATVFAGATFSLALTTIAGVGCGGTTDSAGAGGASSTAGASSLAGANAAAGESSGGGAESGGSNNRGGASSSAGASSTAGASSSAGASNGGGPSCSALTTLAACSARSDCYAISEPILCPGSGTPCPSEFKRCSDNGCDPACTSNSVCVRELTQGGAIMLENDAGACPSGTHATASGGQCARDPSYTCKPIPAACGATIDCTCAASLCSGCRTATAAQVSCELDVP